VATVFSERLGGLTVALAAASAGVAFALQEVIVSIAGWIAIWSGGLYSVGDRVQVGGSIGDVIDIGVLRTTLMECGQWIKGDNYTGRVVRVSNSFIFKEPVYNYSGDFRFLWDEITVPVKFGSDVARARALLERAVGDICGGNADAARADWARMVDRFRLEDARVDPMVTLIFNDNWIEFTLRYVVHYQRRRLTKDELFTRILADVDATQGAVGLASATFHLVETPVFDVRLRGPEDKK
jgi:Mechanosensitive ion channel